MWLVLETLLTSDLQLRRSFACTRRACVLEKKQRPARPNCCRAVRLSGLCYGREVAFRPPSPAAPIQSWSYRLPLGAGYGFLSWWAPIAIIALVTLVQKSIEQTQFHNTTLHHYSSRYSALSTVWANLFPPAYLALSVLLEKFGAWQRVRAALSHSWSQSEGKANKQSTNDSGIELITTCILDLLPILS